MRWSCGLSPSILIVLALLLNAGNALSKNTRTDEYKESAAQQTQQAQPRQQEPMIPLGIFQAAQSGLLEALRTIRAQEEAAAKKNHTQYEPWYAPSVLAQFGLIIVGLLYTRYAWKQWTAINEQATIANRALIETKRSADAAVQAAEAAQQSAASARRALNANRPFLLVVDETLQNLEVAPAKNTRVHIEFAFKNCGKSPAIISKIRARLAITKHPLPISSDASVIIEAFPECGSCEMYKAIGWIDKFENILAADQTSTLYTVWLDTTMYLDIASGTLKPEIREGVMNLSLLVVLHGVITYTDVLQQEYPTEFRGYLKMQATNNERRFDFEFKDRERPKHEDVD